MPDAAHRVAPAVAAAPPLALPGPELAQLARGFAQIFWGWAALWAAGLQLVLDAAGWLTGLMGLAGAAGVLGGAWALTQAQAVGPAWRRYTGNLLVGGVLIAYLSPFAWMWRQAPGEPYLLAHALAWWWAVLAYGVVLNVCLRTLARAADDSGLAWEAVGVGGLQYLLLVGPYTTVVVALVETAQRAGDPLAVLQFILTSRSPLLVFALLMPPALTLALLWSVKDWAFRRLTTPGAPSIVPPAP